MFQSFKLMYLAGTMFRAIYIELWYVHVPYIWYVHIPRSFLNRTKHCNRPSYVHVPRSVMNRPEL